MDYRKTEDGRLIAQRLGSNTPLSFTPAKWDGFRSVRVELHPKHRGLATTAYSFSLTSYEKVEVAERIAALWNLAAERRWTTSQILAMTNAKQNN